jgi:N-acylneuraminate cytidylyltransferase
VRFVRQNVGYQIILKSQKIKMITKKKLIEKCLKIKVIVTDVDGVLTDGGMYYSKNGEELKKFNTRDGMAFELLKKNNLKSVIITKENSKIVEKRAHKIKTDLVFLGIQKKELELPKICKKLSISNDEILYVGDDINDLEVMKLVGFSACPNDAVDEIKKNSDYISPFNGGTGVVRELVDLVLSIQNMSKIK